MTRMMAGVMAAAGMTACSSGASRPATPDATSPSVSSPAFDVSSYPDGTSTGARGTLTPRRGRVVVTQNGSTLKDLDMSGTLVISADDVTVRNVKVRSSDYWAVFIEGTGTKIEDVTVVGDRRSQACIGDNAGHSTFRRLDLSGCPDGIKIGNGSSLEDSFIHDLGTFPGAHNDGVEFSGNSGITLRHNTILNPNPQTSAVFIGVGTQPATRIVVEDNLIAGGGYVIYGPQGRPGTATSSRVKVTDNKFSTRFFPAGGHYGAVAHWETGDGNEWIGNIWVEGPTAGAEVTLGGKSP